MARGTPGKAAKTSGGRPTALRAHNGAYAVTLAPAPRVSHGHILSPLGRILPRSTSIPQMQAAPPMAPPAALYGSP